MKFLVMTILFVCSTASQALAFDGDRKGFVMGLGAGFSPLAQLHGQGALSNLREQKTGLAASFQIGIGLTNSDLLAWEGSLVNYESDLYGDNSTQDFSGVIWSHYFGRQGHSFYSTLGFGKYEFTWHGSRHYICWGPDCEPPPTIPSRAVRGLLIGGGFEFKDHWQVGSFMASSLESADARFSFVHINILLQYTWY